MKCPFPYTLKTGFTVPCGKCIWCLKRRASGWSFRLQKEEKASPGAFFLTLTYAPEHVPISENGFMTLNVRDMTLFWKRVRKKQKSKLRYFYAGEYGSKGDRPHYHAIVFGLDLKTFLGHKDFKQILCGIPLDGKTPFFDTPWFQGEVTVGQVTGASIGYSLKYITKPCGIPRFRNDDRMKTFHRCSKGLGLCYLSDDIVNYHMEDGHYHLTTETGVKLAMPRYYKQKLYENYPEVQLRILNNLPKDERVIYEQDEIRRFRLYSQLKKQ